MMPNLKLLGNKLSEFDPRLDSGKRRNSCWGLSLVPVGPQTARERGNSPTLRIFGRSDWGNSLNLSDPRAPVCNYSNFIDSFPYIHHTLQHRVNETLEEQPKTTICHNGMCLMS